MVGRMTHLESMLRLTDRIQVTNNRSEPADVNAVIKFCRSDRQHDDREGSHARGCLEEHKGALQMAKCLYQMN